MPKLSDNQVPAYCRHRASGQAVVTLDGQDIYLGKYGTAASRQQYNRLIAEWLAAGRRLPVGQGEITVIEMLDRFWQHAEKYYRHGDGSRSDELQNYRYALKPLKDLYGRTPAADFTPLALKALREQMIKPQQVKETDGTVRQEPGWSRNYTNQQIGRIRRVFKWAVSETLIPPAVYQALAAVDGLRRGRSEARETKPVKPVPEQYVEAILPFVSRQVKALIELQLLTGARGGELFPMRRRDIETGRAVWVYRPARHKTEHHGHTREIRLGRRAQTVIEPFLKPDLDGYLFSPAEAEAERREKQHKARKTPLSCGNRPGSNVKKKPQRKAGDHYDRDSYARAITRGCDKADEWAKGGKVIGNDERLVPHWHPHQLRHNAATRLRREYGLEAARVILGQATGAITEIYAEQDVQLAEKVMAEVG